MKMFAFSPIWWISGCSILACVATVSIWNGDMLADETKTIEKHAYQTTATEQPPENEVVAEDEADTTETKPETQDVQTHEPAPSPPTTAEPPDQKTLKGKALEIHLRHRFRATLHTCSRFEGTLTPRQTEGLIKALKSLSDNLRLLDESNSRNRRRFFLLEDQMGNQLRSILATGNLEHPQRARELYSILRRKFEVNPEMELEAMTHYPLFDLSWEPVDNDIDHLFSGNVTIGFDSMFLHLYKAKLAIYVTHSSLGTENDLNDLARLLPDTWTDRYGNKRTLDRSTPQPIDSFRSYLDATEGIPIDDLLRRPMPEASEMGRYGNRLDGIRTAPSQPSVFELRKAAKALSQLLGENYASFPFNDLISTLGI